MSILRPRRGAALGIIAAAAGASVAFIIDGIIRGNHPIVVALPAVLLIGGAAVLAVFVVSNSRLEFGRDVIRVRSAWGRTRELPTTSLSRVVVAPRVGQGLGGDLSVLAIMDAAGGLFARVNLARWDTSEVTAAVSHYRDRVDVIPERIARTDFVARYPRALPYGARHPTLTVVYFTLGTFMLIFGAVALYNALD